MSNVNPMFEPRKQSTTITNQQPRKIRSDKKKDVKIPVNEIQRQLIRSSAFQEGITTTQYMSKLITEHLRVDYINEIHAYDYKDTKKYIHAKLEQETHSKLVRLAIEWGVSQRAAATRILCFALRTM
ncbi:MULTISPECIES: hypothetical protein [Bacillus cereus group]|uniref:Uncharacterized protein n=1 Tax=Bacillus paranthracis TaxID=2026186 RepID=A0A7D8H2X3_9BACI|nr:MULTISPECIES: hypothetical protein [Bacillus cereus group]ANT40260.1 hypothetical protein [Bacillus phage PfNC7401]EJP82567.1 hypothetical protein IAU_05783 [Bacillus cereus IS075]EOO82187.1 hypothetical protein IGS_05950 [Bacillus cereus IS845/00]EOO95307.1 hypothetical protein IGQ_04066 [Bacillus cereus IS195]MPU17524.1 hypothetical protein [Acinetobacter baumannii]BAL21477.1 hypothetical protein BCN_C1_02 [Bacillus cereus NC7401]